jgi:hypothetical protein
MKMKIFITARIVSFAVFVISISACYSPFGKIPRKNGSENQSAKRKYEKNFSGASFDVTTSTGEFSNQVFQKLNEEDFAWLEERASKARKDKEKLKGGYWAIRTFYGGIQSADNSDVEYKKLFEKLNRWKNSYPESITPRIAIFEAWSNYAGEARGTGYANTVSEDGWRLYRERMKNAKQELLEAGAGKCPYWYVGMLEIAKNEGWDFDDFEDLFQEAAAYEPEFYYYYQQKATYLLPRYSGTPGQFERFIEEIKREKGAKMYYQVLSFFILYVGDIPFDGEKYSREQAKQGFVELRKAHGADKKRLNEFAKFLIFSGDIETAAQIFEEIGEDWDKEIWREKGKFDSYRQTAKQTVNFMKKQNFSN